MCTLNDVVESISAYALFHPKNLSNAIAACNTVSLVGIIHTDVSVAAKLLLVC